MPYLYDVKTNKPVMVPDESVREALQSGKFALPQGRVNMVFGDKTVSLPASKALEGYSQGGHIESRDEAASRRVGEGALGTAQAAGLGALRGLTLGLSDAALTRSGLVSARTINDLEKARGKTSVASEITGALAPALLSRGRLGKAAMETPAGMLTKLGSTVSSKIEGALLSKLAKNPKNAGLLVKSIAKAAGFGTSGALEGGLYGVGQAISEQSLGDPRSVGESLAAHVTPGVLLGGGIGGALGLASPSVMAAGSKITGFFSRAAENAPKAIEEAAEKSAIETLGISWKSYGGKAVKKVSGVGDETLKFRQKVKDVLFEDTVLPDGPIYNGTKNPQELVDRVRRAKDIHGAAIGETAQAIDDFATELALKDSRAAEKLIPDMERIKAQVGDLLSEAGEGSESSNILRGFMKDIKEKLDASGRMSMIDLLETKINLGGSFNKSAGKVRGSNDWFQRKLWKIVQQESDRIIENAEGLMEKGIVQRNKLSQKAYSVLTTLEDMTKTFEFGAERPGLLGNIARQSGSSAAFKAPMYRGNFRELMASVGETGLIRGTYKTMFGSSARKAEMYHKWSKLGTLQNILEKSHKTSGKLMDAFVAGTSSKAVGSASKAGVVLMDPFTDRQAKKKAAKAYVDKLNELMSNPQKLADNLSSSLSELSVIAPSISVEMGKTMVNAMNTLVRMQPQTANQYSLQPALNGETEWNDQQLFTFMRNARTILHPETVLQDLANGTITRQQSQLFEMTYPRLYQELCIQLREKIAASNKLLSATQTAAAAAFLGVPPGRAYTADFLRRQQSVWASKSTQPPGKSSKGNRPGDRMETQSQKLKKPV